MRTLLTFLILAAAPLLAAAQPTFKLGVPAHVHPSAVLKVEGNRLLRSPLKDDVGFRLEFQIFKDGKSILKENARAAEAIDLPLKEPGEYAAALELFYPAYKAGNDQKGLFRAVSPYVLYKVAAPGAPPQIIEREPALIIECGKGEGKAQDVKQAKDYGYKLLQGKPVEEWPAASKKHAWADPKSVRFEIALPKEMPGTLRLHLLDGDSAGRKLRITVAGRPLPDVIDFGGAGRTIERSLSSAETKAGKIEVNIESLEKTSAVVSTISFVPAFGS